jgi:tRNA G26 N,N-dimethylase Trm1
MRKKLIGRKSTEETRKKLSAIRKGKYCGENNSAYGNLWITNGTNNKFIKKDEEIPSGWYKGRTVNTKESKWWVNCDGITKFQKECPGEGWKRGRIF